MFRTELLLILPLVVAVTAVPVIETAPPLQPVGANTSIASADKLPEPAPVLDSQPEEPNVVVLLVVVPLPTDKPAPVSEQSPAPEPIQPPAENSKPTVKCPHKYGVYSMNDFECRKYIRCHKGLATIMNCSTGLVFNPQMRYCDFPANVPQCNPKGNPTNLQPKPAHPQFVQQSNTAALDEGRAILALIEPQPEEMVANSTLKM